MKRLKALFYYLQWKRYSKKAYVTDSFALQGKYVSKSIWYSNKYNRILGKDNLEQQRFDKLMKSQKALSIRIH